VSDSETVSLKAAHGLLKQALKQAGTSSQNAEIVAAATISRRGTGCRVWPLTPRR
jgi:LDH2 family malate/lactate/ureidoglycolate dehydrogenase